MAENKERDCTECIAYWNMLEGDVCGLGFKVAEDAVGGYGTWSTEVHPVENACTEIAMPTTREDFVKAAADLGIEWDIDEVVDGNALW